MNPFEQLEAINYSNYLKELFASKKIGDSFKIDSKGREIASVRASVFNLESYKVKTKTNEQGELWVKIIDKKS